MFVKYLMMWEALVIFILSAYLFFRLTCGKTESVTCLVGKTALVTGGNAGIGLQVCLGLASRGCRVILTGRNNLEVAKTLIVERTKNPNIEARYVDFLSFESVRKLAESLKKDVDKIDILINNAGVSSIPIIFTKDGLHPVMQVNHFSPFLLTHLLLDLVRKSGPGARIIFTSSNTAYFHILNTYTFENPSTRYSVITNFFNYCNTKFLNIVTADVLADKLKSSGITVNSVHPGWVRTDIFTKFGKSSSTPGSEIFSLLMNLMLKFTGKSIFEGGQPIIDLATSPSVDSVTGKFFQDCKIFPKPRKAGNKDFADATWRHSEKCVKLREDEKIS